MFSSHELSVRNISCHPLNPFSLLKVFLRPLPPFRPAPPVPLVLHTISGSAVSFDGSYWPLSSSTLCQAVVNLSPPCSTPARHGIPPFIATASVQTNFGTPKIHGCSNVKPYVAPNCLKSSVRHVRQFCSGHPLPGSPPSPTCRTSVSSEVARTSAPLLRCPARAVAAAWMAASPSRADRSASSSPTQPKLLEYLYDNGHHPRQSVRRLRHHARRHRGHTAQLTPSALLGPLVSPPLLPPRPFR